MLAESPTSFLLKRAGFSVKVEIGSKGRRTITKVRKVKLDFKRAEIVIHADCKIFRLI